MQINLRHKFPQFVFFAKGDVSKASYDVRAGGGDGSGGVGLEAGCPGAGGGLPCLHLEPPPLQLHLPSAELDERTCISFV